MAETPPRLPKKRLDIGIHAKRLRAFPLIWLVLVALGFFSDQAVGADGFPALASSVNLPGYPLLMRANTVGHRAIVMLTRSARDSTQAGLIVDIDDSTRPTVRGQFSVQGNVEQLSLSPDGSGAILLVSNPASRPGESTFSIISLNLSDPARPIETSRHTLPVKSMLWSARSIALASDASGYAIIPDSDLYPNNRGTVFVHKFGAPGPT